MTRRTPPIHGGPDWATYIILAAILFLIAAVPIYLGIF